MLLAAGTLSGRAFVTDTIHHTYKPKAQLSKVNSTQYISLSVLVNNEKKNRISVSKNGYCKFTTGAPKRFFQKAFTQVLEDRELQVTTNSPEKFQVIVDLPERI